MKDSIEKPKSTKGYVVLSQAYEYNDEVYQKVDGGNAVKVFLDKKEAEKQVVALSRKELADCNIKEYCYGLSDISSKSFETIKERWNKIAPADSQIIDEDNPWELIVWKNVTEEEATEILKIFDKLRLFFIKETDIE